MSEQFLENNQELLQKIKDGEMDEYLINRNVGSFFMCLFEERHWDCIPLFFEFLTWYTGENYSNECEWVQESLNKSHEEFEEFEKMVDENPLLKLLIALSD